MGRDVGTVGRGQKRLYARQVATVTEPGYYADGGGLYLQVSKTGSKSWIYRYTRAGKTTDMGLGALADVGLPEARAQAEAYRKLRLEGKDPLRSRQERQARAAGIPSFAEATAAYIADHRAAWSNPKHAQQWQSTLDRYAMPRLGRKGVHGSHERFGRRARSQQLARFNADGRGRRILRRLHGELDRWAL